MSFAEKLENVRLSLSIWAPFVWSGGLELFLGGGPGGPRIWTSRMNTAATVPAAAANTVPTMNAAW